jgi:hypothetical protein
MFKEKVVLFSAAFALVLAIVSQVFADDIQKLSIDKALDIALKNNLTRFVSKASIDIAQAQHKQALAWDWLFPNNLLLLWVETLVLRACMDKAQPSGLPYP